MNKISICTDYFSGNGTVLLDDIEISRFVKEVSIVNRVGKQVELKLTLVGELEFISSFNRGGRS